MQYQDKPQLRKAMTGFLNQRLRVYKMLCASSGDTDLILKYACIQYIKTQWAIVSPWDYWRHCREVIIQEGRLKSILPSAAGNHVTIRLHMLELIEHCRMVQKINCHEYREKALSSHLQ